MKKKILIIFLFIFAISATNFGYENVVEPIASSKKPKSLMLIGTDNSEYRDELFDNSKDSMTDSIMVVTINPNFSKVELTSIPRDTSVDYVCESNTNIPDYQDQINQLFAVSDYNVSCLKDTVSNFLNVPIDYYAIVNMDKIIEIIDTVGPLEIKAHAADGSLNAVSPDGLTNFSWVNNETYNMDGVEAFLYARTRYDSEKDYGRGIRQQQIVTNLASKILDGGFSMDVLKKLLAMVDTDIDPVLAFRYYKFLQNNNENIDKLKNDAQDIVLDDLPAQTWEKLFNFYEYQYDVVDQETVSKFEQKVISDKLKIDDYFMNSHQFFNDKANNHFVVVEQQLSEIQNSLRSNLELETEDVKMPVKNYGDNEANGLIKHGTIKE